MSSHEARLGRIMDAKLILERNLVNGRKLPYYLAINLIMIGLKVTRANALDYFTILKKETEFETDGFSIFVKKKEAVD